MRVRAKKMDGQSYSGYYNYVRRKAGDVFNLLDTEPDPKKNRHFSFKWMEVVDEDVPATPAPGEPRTEDLIEDGVLTADGKLPGPKPDLDGAVALSDVKRQKDTPETRRVKEALQGTAAATGRGRKR